MPTEKKLLVLLEEKDEWIAQLEDALAKCEAELEETARRLKEQEQAFVAFTNSRSWKLTQQLARMGRAIVPAQSRRRRLLRLGYRGLLGIVRLRSREYRAIQLERLGNRLHDGFDGLASRIVGTGSKRSGASGRLSRRVSKLPGFSQFDQVDVSIIIPVYDHFEETLACLQVDQPGGRRTGL